MPVISLLHPSLDVRTLGTEASLNRYDTLVVPEMVEVGIEPDFDMWAETTVFVDLGSNANLTTPYWIAAAEVGTANYPAQVTWELGILDDIVQATRTDPSQRLGGTEPLIYANFDFSAWYGFPNVPTQQFAENSEDLSDPSKRLGGSNPLLQNGPLNGAMISGRSVSRRYSAMVDPTGRLRN